LVLLYVPRAQGAAAVLHALLCRREPLLGGRVLAPLRSQWGLGLGHPGSNLIVCSNVDGDYMQIQAFRDSEGAQFVRFRPGQIAHGGKHPCALPGEQFGREPPEARRTASNQHALARKVELGRLDRLSRCSAGGGEKRGGGGGSGSGEERATVEAHVRFVLG
jgi:hypothetical protein